MKNTHTHLCKWGKFNLYCENNYFTDLDSNQAQEKKQLMMEWGCQQMLQIPAIERVGFVSFDILNVNLSSPISFRVNFGTTSFIAISTVYENLHILPQSELNVPYIHEIFNQSHPVGLRIYSVIIPSSLFNRSPLKLKTTQATTHQVGIIDGNRYFAIREQLLTNQVLICNIDMASTAKNGTEEARRTYLPSIINSIIDAGMTPVLFMNQQAAQDLNYNTLCEVIDNVDNNRQFHSIFFTSHLHGEVPKLLHRSVFNYLYFFDIIATDINHFPLSAIGNYIPYLDEFMLCSDYSGQQVKALYPEANEIISTGYLPVTLPPKTPIPKEINELDEFHFLVGNAYAHKLLKPTINFLCVNFPNTQFVVLGKSCEYNKFENLHVFESNFTSDEIVDALYQYAESIIYPSVYEGLGYPWIKGLAIGKDVWVYQSMLIDEVMRAYPLSKDRLHVFESMGELESQFAIFLHTHKTTSQSVYNMKSTIEPYEKHVCAALAKRITTPPHKLRIQKF